MIDKLQSLRWCATINASARIGIATGKDEIAHNVLVALRRAMITPSEASPANRTLLRVLGHGPPSNGI
jgi:hypothetical protein